MKTSILNLSNHFYFKACHLYCPNLNCTNLVAEMASVFYIDLAFETHLNTPTAKSIVGVSRTEEQHPDFCVSLTKKDF